MNIKSALLVSFVLFFYLFFNSNQYVSGAEQKGSLKYKPTIAIDLDGVLNQYEKGKFDENYIPPIKKGAKNFLYKLHKNGYNLVLFTNRKPLLASKWLIENKIDMYFSDVTNVKPKAIIYLDDRSINFNGNYNEAFNNINNFKVYWKE